MPPIHPAIDPIVMLLFNHNFGLLFWAAAPLLAGLFGRNAGPERPLLDHPRHARGDVGGARRRAVAAVPPLTPRY